MRLRLIGRQTQAFRAFIAATLLSGFALALGLSAAPLLHDCLHSADRANHECAATLLSSGSVEHSGCEPIPTQPLPLPGVAAFRKQLHLRLPGCLAFTRLEHAPPALS